MTHHDIDPWPIPKDKTPLYINEPRLIDESLRNKEQNMDIAPAEDNIRVYVPLDINHNALIKMLNYVVRRYGKYFMKRGIIVTEEFPWQKKSLKS